MGERADSVVKTDENIVEKRLNRQPISLPSLLRKDLESLKELQIRIM